MTSVDPVAASLRVTAIRKQGRLIAGGLAGLAVVAFCLWFFNNMYLDGRDRMLIGGFYNPLFIAVATVTSSFTAAVFWYELSQFRPQFSWVLSMVAGLLAIVAAMALTGILYSVVLLIAELVSRGGLTGFPDVKSITLFRVVLAVLVFAFAPLFLGIAIGFASLVIAGVFTVPTAIAVCLVATGWSRWRLRGEGLASYAFAKAGHTNAGQWPKR